MIEQLKESIARLGAIKEAGHQQKEQLKEIASTLKIESECIKDVAKITGLLSLAWGKLAKAAVVLAKASCRTATILAAMGEKDAVTLQHLKELQEKYATLEEVKNG